VQKVKTVFCPDPTKSAVARNNLYSEGTRGKSLEYEEFERLKDSGEMTMETYESIVRGHFFQSADDGHQESCDICQEIDWFDHIFSEEKDLEYVSAGLMTWLMSQMDHSHVILDTASKIPNAPLGWIEGLLPEYWYEVLDLLVDSDTTVRAKLDLWSKNPNCTKRMIENYIKNVHEIRNSNPEMTSQDGGDEVIYDEGLTCMTIDDVQNCISCRQLASEYGVEFNPPYHWPFHD
jgi:hypothetical protein